MGCRHLRALLQGPFLYLLQVYFQLLRMQTNPGSCPARRAHDLRRRRLSWKSPHLHSTPPRSHASSQRPTRWESSAIRHHLHSLCLRHPHHHSLLRHNHDSYPRGTALPDLGHKLEMAHLCNTLNSSTLDTAYLLAAHYRPWHRPHTYQIAKAQTDRNCGAA